ncbi:protein slit [Papilio machaon]|uniref:protein slit n=1 Tax=Papilio machaon TaxID=76193 RepID=UPI001E662A57|nr:protein slit [Papilio machaon]
MRGAVLSVLCALSAVLLGPGAAAAGAGACPWACACRPGALDCAHRGLLHAPRRLPGDAHRLDLQGNNLTIIFQSDFQNLNELKILQLSENQIHTIERDAFLALSSLERLKLNNNRIGHLPDGIFVRLKHLQRLDLSRNELTAISRRTFRGLTSLKSLHLDGNHLKCIDDKALEHMKSLEVLTLNSNNLTYLSLEPASVARLHTLRLTDNPVVCDCRVARLLVALRASAFVGVGARCQAPATLRGALLTDLEDSDLICNGPIAVTSECSAEPRCPPPCRCTAEGTLDCREKLLAELPASIPHRTVEIRLEQNEITEVGAGAFVAIKVVARIDLSNNKIVKIAADAFNGLTRLTSLVLYGNKIKDLPAGIFHGLSSLQLLLLNSNEISCIRKDTFRDLQSLKLLSLYDNNIRSIPNGTFDSLTGIQTLHLGRNPFTCDCSLRWLAAYLRKNPIETSGAKCDSPKRLARKRIDALRDENFKCKPGEETEGDRGSCGATGACPAACACEWDARGVRVACARAGQNDVPRDLPMATHALLMSDNNLRQIKSDGLFGRLPDLNKLDFRNNGITEIEDNAFDGAANMQELLLDGNHLATVTDKMFFGLHSLVTLSLADNKIKCITPGAFDHLNLLKTLTLSGNPIHCSCHVGWLAGWLRTRRLAPGAACASPANLRGANIPHLELTDFKCTAEDKGCLSAEYCPAACACAGTVVRCARAQLTALPHNIPRQTTELYLESNEITSLEPEQIRHLTQLTRLDLSNNKIDVLHNNTFDGLTKLSTLIVSYNRLRCVQRDALKGLTQLRVLSLHGNNISMLADGVFRDLESISHVALGSNPLYCDCHARWLSEWVKSAGEYVEAGIAKCSEPARMRDKLVLSTASSAFVCTEKVPSEVVSKCDRCVRSPCANGGTCSATRGGFSCACARGFHGETCQQRIDACYGAPCRHGTCTLLEEGRFHCSCEAGYTGVRCEVDIDDCAGHKCQNNATCLDHLEGYTCKCAPGYMGEYCETKIPFCSAEFNPCENGAICTDHGSHYTCSCPRGYAGINCTINPDDCLDHMCQNGATCIDGLEEYRCACAAGYAGRYCEAAPHAALGTSPCAHHDCVHGVCYLPAPAPAQPAGTALQDDIMMERPLLGATNDYLCKCAPGYSGRLCEYLTSLTFNHNDSLVELEPLRTSPQANVTLVFSTTQHHGVLLYFGDSEHLAVELFNGRIRISYDVGNHPTSTMYSFEMVSDGSYHKAELLAVKKNFTLKVDDGPARSIINEGTKEYLRLDRPMFLGGVPEDVAKDAFSKWHLRNITSFKGCLKEAWINHKRVDFVNAARTQRTLAGCGGDEPPPAPPSHALQEDGAHKPDPCVPNPCARGGRCVREEGSASDYTCKCRAGTAGAQCELRTGIGGAPSIGLNKPPTRKMISNVQASPASPAHKQLSNEQSQAQTSPAPGGCRKEATRDTVSEGSCRSRRAVRGARCAARPDSRACGKGQCCQPKRTKKRKIRLVCDDGTRYTKEIEIVRKCACGKKCGRTSPFLL